MLPDSLLWLFPAVFVLHEAEEVVFLPTWLHRRMPELTHRFPRLAVRMLSRLDGISRREFAAIAAEELLLLVGATACALFAGCLYPWLALFLAFGLHLVGHLLQTFLVRGHVPVVLTSLIGLTCCVWGLCVLIGSRMFSPGEYLLCGAAGCIVAAVNLLSMHALAAALRRGRSLP